MFSFSKSHQCGQCVASNYARTMPCRVLTKSSLDTPLTLPESPPRDPVPVITVLQAPVSRFGDTAANDGALAALEHTSLPTAVGDLSCRKQWMVLTPMLGMTYSPLNGWELGRVYMDLYGSIIMDPKNDCSGYILNMGVQWGFSEWIWMTSIICGCISSKLAEDQDMSCSAAETSEGTHLLCRNFESSWTSRISPI